MISASEMFPLYLKVRSLLALFQILQSKAITDSHPLDAACFLGMCSSNDLTTRLLAHFSQDIDPLGFVYFARCIEVF